MVFLSTEAEIKNDSSTEGEGKKSERERADNEMQLEFLSSRGRSKGSHFAVLQYKVVKDVTKPLAPVLTSQPQHCTYITVRIAVSGPVVVHPQHI